MIKILVVAQFDSIHTSRWVRQFDSKYEIYLFPSIFRQAHKSLRDKPTRNPFRSNSDNSAKKSRVFLVQVLPWSWLNFILNGVIQKFLSSSWKLWLLKKTIRSIQPDLIHSLELQNAGYLCLDAKLDLASQMPTWIATNWGSDIYYFAQFEDHKKRIIPILQTANYYSAECTRDYVLAQKMGMTAKPLPVIPNAGGLELDLCLRLRNQITPSQRKTIILKGYQSVFGRAFNGLEALALIQNQLGGMKVVIYSASDAVTEKARSLLTSPHLQLKIYHHDQPLTHTQILEIQAESRVYIGLSVSDGICTSLLESMALGSFPIQTDTSCAEEWVVPDQSGFIVKYEDIQTLSKLILKAVQDNDLVDHAAKINWDVISQKASKEKIQSVATSFYETALKESATVVK